MPAITHLMLKNFRKFDFLRLNFQPATNVLIRDNECGKSSVFLALDLVLSGSRHWVETLGAESLIYRQAVIAFRVGQRRADLLPELIADVSLIYTGNPDQNRRQNLMDRDADGLRMHIVPMLEVYGQDISHVLEEDPASFPFEYYAVKFLTFSGSPYAGFSRHVHHLMLDSARIGIDYAAQEYTRTLSNVNVAVSDRYRLENSWRQQKDRFQEQHLSAINEEIETCQFGIRSGMRAGLEASLDVMEGGIPIRDRGKRRQCFIKTEFALRRREQHKELDALLLEEPENHLSHVNRRNL